MNIGILDHMGYGNLGDAATQDVVLASIKKRMPNAGIIGFSLVPQDTINRHGIPCYPIRQSVWVLEAASNDVPSSRPNSTLRATLKGVPLIYWWAKPLLRVARELRFCLSSYRVLKTLDVLIISGGGQIDDLWPGQPYTLFKFALLTRLARKRVVFLNVGVGPLRRRLDRLFAKWSIGLSNYRSVRDLDSQKRLAGFGVNKEVDVYPDLVYAFRVSGLTESRSHSRKKVCVALNPIGFCDPRVWPRKNKDVYERYLDKLTSFCLWVFSRGYSLRIFTTDNNIDQLAIADIKARLAENVSTPAVLNEIFETPRDNVITVLREMARFDVIVTSKFHGIVFSHLFHTPVIALSYHRKMDVAMRAVGHGRYCADIEHFDKDWLIRTCCAVVDESEAIKRQTADAVTRNAALLEQQFDAVFTRELPLAKS